MYSSAQSLLQQKLNYILYCKDIIFNLQNYTNVTGMRPTEGTISNWRGYFNRKYSTPFVAKRCSHEGLIFHRLLDVVWSVGKISSLRPNTQAFITISVRHGAINSFTLSQKTPQGHCPIRTEHPASQRDSVNLLVTTPPAPASNSSDYGPRGVTQYIADGVSVVLTITTLDVVRVDADDTASRLRTARFCMIMLPLSLSSSSLSAGNYHICLAGDIVVILKMS